MWRFSEFVGAYNAYLVLTKQQIPNNVSIDRKFNEPKSD